MSLDLVSSVGALAHLFPGADLDPVHTLSVAGATHGHVVPVLPLIRPYSPSDSDSLSSSCFFLDLTLSPLNSSHSFVSRGHSVLLDYLSGVGVVHSGVTVSDSGVTHLYLLVDPPADFDLSVFYSKLSSFRHRVRSLLISHCKFKCERIDVSEFLALPGVDKTTLSGLTASGLLSHFKSLDVPVRRLTAPGHSLPCLDVIRFDLISTLFGGSQPLRDLVWHGRSDFGSDYHFESRVIRVLFCYGLTRVEVDHVLRDYVVGRWRDRGDSARSTMLSNGESDIRSGLIFGRKFVKAFHVRDGVYWFLDRLGGSDAWVDCGGASVVHSKLFSEGSHLYELLYKALWWISHDRDLSAEDLASFLYHHGIDVCGGLLSQDLANAFTFKGRDGIRSLADLVLRLGDGRYFRPAYSDDGVSGFDRLAIFKVFDLANMRPTLTFDCRRLSRLNIGTRASFVSYLRDLLPYAYIRFYGRLDDLRYFASEHGDFFDVDVTHVDPDLGNLLVSPGQVPKELIKLLSCLGGGGSVGYRSLYPLFDRAESTVRGYVRDAIHLGFVERVTVSGFVQFRLTPSGRSYVRFFDDFHFSNFGPRFDPCGVAPGALGESYTGLDLSFVDRMQRGDLCFVEDGGIPFVRPGLVYDGGKRVYASSTLYGDIGYWLSALCDQLLSPYVRDHILTPSVLEGILVDHSLEDLWTVYNVGWLQDWYDSDAFGGRLKKVWRSVCAGRVKLSDFLFWLRNNVLSSVDRHDMGAYFRTLHGILGTVVVLLHLGGFDLRFVTHCDDVNRNWHGKRFVSLRDLFRYMLPKLALVDDRNNLYRVLFEDRKEKLEQGDYDSVSGDGSLICDFLFLGDCIDLVSRAARSGLDVLSGDRRPGAPEAVSFDPELFVHGSGGLFGFTKHLLDGRRIDYDGFDVSGLVSLIPSYHGCYRFVRSLPEYSHLDDSLVRRGLLAARDYVGLGQTVTIRRMLGCLLDGPCSVSDLKSAVGRQNFDNNIEHLSDLVSVFDCGSFRLVLPLVHGVRKLRSDFLSGLGASGFKLLLGVYERFSVSMLGS